MDDADLSKMFSKRMGGKSSKLAKMLGGSPKKDAHIKKKKSRGGLADLFGSGDEELPVTAPMAATEELGELANLDVVNESVSNTAAALDSAPIRKSWRPKLTLRSHFDGVRAVLFHPDTNQLVSCSEDHTVKVWELNLSSKK